MNVSAINAIEGSTLFLTGHMKGFLHVLGEQMSLISGSPIRSLNVKFTSVLVPALA